jgi:hypothetical protein
LNDYSIRDTVFQSYLARGAVVLYHPELQIMAQAILFEEIFDIRALNENGKKFERGWFHDHRLTKFD